MDSKDFEAIFAKQERSSKIANFLYQFPLLFLVFAAFAGPAGGWEGGWPALCLAMACYIYCFSVVSNAQHFKVLYELTLVKEALRDLRSRA
jgi:hypothetical protein